MWTDVLQTSVIIGFIGLIFRFHQAKLTKLEDKKLNKDMFEQVQTTILEDLKKGEQKFEKVLDVMGEHGQTLARMDERIKNLAKKNGVE